MFHSMTKFDKYKMGMACLYLSAKTEERPQRIDTVIHKAYKFLYKKEGTASPSSEVSFSILFFLPCDINFKN